MGAWRGSEVLGTGLRAAAVAGPAWQSQWVPFPGGSRPLDSVPWIPSSRPLPIRRLVQLTLNRLHIAILLCFVSIWVTVDFTFSVLYLTPVLSHFSAGLSTILI